MASCSLRTRHQNRMFRRNAARWSGVFLAWLFLLLMIGAVFGNSFAHDPTIALTVDYMLFVAGAVMVTITLTLERWVSAPPAIKCPECGGNIVPDAEWTCGYCGKTNATQPLVGWCEFCKEAPASVLCPRDGKVIQLGPHAPVDGNHAMTEPVETQITVASPVDEILQEKARLEAETEAIHAETARLEALASRKQVEGRLNDTVAKTPEARLRQLLGLKMELPEARKKLEKELAEQYADDPEGLKTAMKRLEAAEAELLDDEMV